MDQTYWTPPIPFIYPDGYVYDQDLNKEIYKQGTPIPSGSASFELPFGNATAYPSGIYWPPYDKYWDEICERFYERDKAYTYHMKDNEFLTNLNRDGGAFFGINGIYPPMPYSIVIYRTKDHIYFADVRGNIKYAISDSVDWLRLERTKYSGFALLGGSGNVVKIFNLLGEKLIEGQPTSTVKAVSGGPRWALLVCDGTRYLLTDIKGLEYYDITGNMPIYNKVFITPADSYWRSIIFSGNVVGWHDGSENSPIQVIKQLDSSYEEIKKDSAGWYVKTENGSLYFTKSGKIHLKDVHRTTTDDSVSYSGDFICPQVIFEYDAQYKVWGEYNLDIDAVLDSSWINYLRTKKESFKKVHDEYHYKIRPIITVNNELYKIHIDVDYRDAPYTLENIP